MTKMYKRIVLASVLCSSSLVAADPTTDITPLELAGPFPSLAASCKAAPPCGSTDTDANKPATKPDCAAVLDPRGDIVGHVPESIKSDDRVPAMTHKTASSEIRIGGVRCAEPRDVPRKNAQYYVFVHRRDGWWRTKAPMFEYDYNDECGGGLYIRWNDKPSRTIAGVTAEDGCITCGRESESSTLAELMLRVELTGKTPAVFPFLPVGSRSHTGGVSESSPYHTDERCKESSSAVSLKESWPSDTEVVLEGKPAPGVSGGGLWLRSIVGSGAIAPGRYRFTRP